MNTTSTALDLAHRMDIGQSLLSSYDQTLLQTIRQNVAPEAPQSQFDLFLEVCARYQLNPITGEAYLAKFGSRDGGGNRWTIMVSDAGFRAVAARHPTYEGTQADVVRQYDTFKVRHTAGGVEVTHEYELGFDDFAGVEREVDSESGEILREGQPSAREEDAEQRMLRKRGRIVGAWAIVYRSDRKPVFFFAPWGEYAPSPVARAWKSNPSSMILKCAKASARREAFSLSGLYSEAEMERAYAMSLAPGEGGEAYEDDTATLYGGDDDLGEWLRQLVDAVNAIKPGSYRPAKVRMALSGATDLEREAFANEVARKLEQVGATVPPRPGSEENSAESAEDAEEQVADAEVVG